MRAANGSRTAMMCLVVAAVILLVGRAAEADFVFGEPTNLGPLVNSSSFEGSPTISMDGLELYLASIGANGTVDLFVTTREMIEDDWGEPVTLGPTVNSSAIDIEPCVSTDGLQLYFESRRSGNLSAKADLWITTRTNTDDSWGEPMNLGSIVNSTGGDSGPSHSSDGLELFFCSSRVGNQMDVFVTKRVTINGDWEHPTNLGALINTTQHEWCPSISFDGLILLFTRGPEETGNIWMARRETVIGNWSAPVELDSPINSPFGEFPGRITADGRTLYFESNRPAGFGDWDIWQAPIIPIVDFNGDGKADGAEVCTMANCWGTDDSLCDIGPMPWGDGVVDVQDLRVLAEYIGGPVDDPTLVAHWALDEIEGDVAHDSGYANDAAILGAAIWHPEGGAVGGALEFNGVDTCLETPEVVNPVDGCFSILAWVQGGAPGQVIVSQADGQNWLMADASDGVLMTALAPAVSRKSAPLVADVPITDGSWHRIAFVRDDATRALYVDGMLVAEDAQLTLAPCTGGLYIGCDKDQTPGTFFSGLIDDIRIYNRAVKP